MMHMHVGNGRTRKPSSTSVAWATGDRELHPFLDPLVDKPLKPHASVWGGVRYALKLSKVDLLSVL
jgi:hypothetical protein